MLLSQAFQRYESDKRLEGYSPHTLKSYGIQSSLLARQLGDVDIDSVTFDQLKAYLAQNAGRLKPSSLGHRVRFLKSLFRWAYDEAFTQRNVASKLREPKMGARVPKALSDEDIEELRESCVLPIEHVIIEFMFSTGCRIGEMTKLNRGDIDWESRSVVVNGKGDKEREVYFSIKAEIWLRRYLRERNDSDPALFVTERRPHRRLSIPQIRYVVKRVARRANVTTNVYPHKLRHSYATHLLNNGAPLEAIQSLLGHSKMETTRLYAQLSGPRRKELYRKYF